MTTRSETHSCAVTPTVTPGQRSITPGAARITPAIATQVPRRGNLQVCLRKIRVSRGAGIAGAIASDGFGIESRRRLT